MGTIYLNDIKYSGGGSSGGSGSTVTLADNASGGVDITVGSTTKTLAKETELTSKQDKIVAGSNITIGADGKTISATIPSIPTVSIADNSTAGVDITVNGTTKTVAAQSDVTALNEDIADKADILKYIEEEKSGSIISLANIHSYKITNELSNVYNYDNNNFFGLDTVEETTSAGITYSCDGKTIKLNGISNNWFSIYFPVKIPEYVVNKYFYLRIKAKSGSVVTVGTYPRFISPICHNTSGDRMYFDFNSSKQGTCYSLYSNRGIQIQADANSGFNNCEIEVYFSVIEDNANFTSSTCSARLSNTKYTNDTGYIVSLTNSNIEVYTELKNPSSVVYTDDISNLLDLKHLESNEISIKDYCSVWRNGGLTNGEFTPDNRRIMSDELMEFKEETVLKIAHNRRIGVQFFDADGSYLSDSGWQRLSYTIPANSYIKMVISPVPVTDSSDFPESSYYGDVDLYTSWVKIENDISKSIGTSNYPYKPLSSFELYYSSDVARRMQGGCINGDYLYWAQTDDTTATIYKMDLTSGEVVKTVNGNYGHAGDMTFDKVLNRLIILNAENTNTTFYYLSGDDLSLKDTKVIKTYEYRIGAIAYDSITDDYIVEFARNNSWNHYYYARVDKDFNVKKRCEPIVNGYLMQGIETDGKYVYTMYYEDSVILVYDRDFHYVGYHQFAFNYEAEFIAYKSDNLFYIGEDGEKKIYKMQRKYLWNN